MTREMTERYMNLLDEHHQKNPFVQTNGSTICRACMEAWPCDMRQVLDAFADLGKVLEIVSVMNMKGFALVSQLAETLQMRIDVDTALSSSDQPLADVGTVALLADAKAYLEVGVPG